MTGNSLPSLSFDSTVLDWLACPVCQGALRLDESRLRCRTCARAYPIVDGIPVLIAERAEPSKPPSPLDI